MFQSAVGLAGFLFKVIHVKSLTISVLESDVSSEMMSAVLNWDCCGFHCLVFNIDKYFLM